MDDPDTYATKEKFLEEADKKGLDYSGLTDEEIEMFQKWIEDYLERKRISNDRVFQLKFHFNIKWRRIGNKHVFPSCDSNDILKSGGEYIKKATRRGSM